MRANVYSLEVRATPANDYVRSTRDSPLGESRVRTRASHVYTRARVRITSRDPILGEGKHKWEPILGGIPQERGAIF